MATSNFIKICIKSDAIVTEGEERALSAKDTWETISQEWANNPADGEAFEWADIPGLQAGIALRRQESEGYGKCTQLYVEVDYTYTPPPPPTPPVVEAAAAPEYQKREVARIGTEAEATLENALSRVTEFSAATGDATGGSTTTLEDTNAVWEVNRWKDAVVEITHAADGKHYFVTITSNTADTLTFPAIAVTVAADDHYEIRLSVRIIKISGQVVQVSGEVVSIETPTMLKTGPVRTLASASGGVVLHSGSVKAAVVKALTDNSGIVLVGGSGDRPWYESVGSAQGMILAAGEAQSKDVNNFDAIYVVAQVSGDKVCFEGVN